MMKFNPSYKYRHRHYRLTHIYFDIYVLKLITSLLSIINISNAAQSLPSKTQVICQTNDECSQVFHGPVTCVGNVCQCGKNFVSSKHGTVCLPVAMLGDKCETSDQCNYTDPFAFCVFSSTLDPNPLYCQCRYGYAETTLNKERRICVQLHIGSGFFGGIPHFDSRDLVPIIMGCLAAGLALCACCAGIIQLMRKKHSRDVLEAECVNQQGMVIFHQRDLLSDSTAQEMILVSDSEPAISDQAFHDCPPSYEEVIIPPSYEEAMKNCRAFQPINTV